MTRLDLAFVPDPGEVADDRRAFGLNSFAIRLAITGL